jgi:ubiquinone/menaquinone biosynthesis C-methylase UbiE
MTHISSKWPKVFPELTAEQKRISDEFMHYWHQVLPKKYKFANQFNHIYAIKNAPVHFKKTLEIGAGIGEHLAYEQLSPEQLANYVALDMRENMAVEIQQKYPQIRVLISDCQKPIPLGDDEFDRILAIHVLEHLTNLPNAIKEIYRICQKKHGVFSVVIPCEGGGFYSLARRISAQRMFEKRYKQSYTWFIQREHVNKPAEILAEILPYFKLIDRQFFPMRFLPFVWCNLCIGLTFTPKRDPSA